MDQLVEIIKVLGTPSKEQIRQMNSNYTEFKFPQIKAHPWNKVDTQGGLGIEVKETWNHSNVYFKGGLEHI